MDFKKLFIGGLCASAVLVSCTKELSAPSVESNQATISLGEGLTITGSKGTFGAETKAGYGKGLVPYWEEKDELGAAFYSAVDGYDYSTGKVTNVAPSQNKFMSNTWFELNDFENENHTRATFTATANLMAGAYVLYFPFDEKWTVIKDKLPVNTVQTTQIMDLNKGEYAHLGENIFAYTTYKAVPGGRNLEENFTLAPVTNVLSLKFRVEDETLMQLAGKIDIAEVVLEGDVMYENGTVSLPAALAVADYNSAEFKSEAKYAGNEKVNQIILHVKNAGDGYTITKTGSANATEPVHISVLPFDVNGRSFKVKVVTSEGRVYESENIAVKNGFFTTGVAGMGQHINLSIALSREETGEIYTEDQFKAQWNAAVAGTEDKTLTVGTDLVVKDFPMTKSNEDVTITIKGINDATLRVEGDLDIEDGKLVVDLPLTVDGDFTFGNNASISGKGTLSVTGQTTIDGAGDADIKIVKMGDVAISRTGEFKINGEETVEVGKIVNRGKLSLSNFDIENLENKADKGAVTIGSNVKVIGTLDNYGTISGSNSLTNHGTVNLFNTSAVKIVNAVAIPAQGLSAGTINVKANLTLNAENHSTVVVDAGKNLTILDTYTDDADAKIDATANDAQVTVGSSTKAATVNGEIVSGVNTKEVKVVNSTKYNVRYIVNKNSDVNAWVETLAKSSDKDSKKVISEIRATDFVFNSNLCQNYNNVEIMDGAVMLINRINCNLYANTTVKGNATIKGTVDTASLNLTPTAFYTFLLEKGTLTFDGTLTVIGTLTQKYNTAIKYGAKVTHTDVTEEYEKN